MYAGRGTAREAAKKKRWMVIIPQHAIDMDLEEVGEDRLAKCKIEKKKKKRKEGKKERTKMMVNLVWFCSHLELQQKSRKRRGVDDASPTRLTRKCLKRPRHPGAGCPEEEPC